jgi:hypothetical protein
MKKLIGRIVLVTVLGLNLGSASCYAYGDSYVGYGYTQDYYGDVFYSAPIDRYGYGYGFYGHP